MNLSARWNRLSFFALAALTAGALAFGCTVTTGNIDDPDGGGGSNTNGKDSGDTDTDAGSTDTDAATTDPDADTTNACADNQQPAEFVIQSAACQACAETKCCSQLVGCFNLDPGSDGEGNKNPTCTEYAEYYEGCVADCYAADADAGDDDIEQCITDTCRIGNPAIADAWEAVTNCALDSCATECAGE